ncbi:MAG: uracil-DNA glycosylase [Planctomycetaceae bacterium]|nr:uracil-DNA glycosylase [Planctomycetaceae bacterium]
MSTNRIVAQYLQHLQRLGVAYVPTVDFAPLLAASTGEKTRSKPVASAIKSASGSKPPAAQIPGLVRQPLQVVSDGVSVPQPLPEVAEVLAGAMGSVEKKAEALCQLAGIVAKCQRCEQLVRTRRQTVFGVGNPDAQIMFIGEAPGADEDAQGEPFVGKAGQLLNKIIAASKLRREDLYICNILRCRPPGNRTPQQQEATNCREFLEAQIRIVQPQYIICWGTVAAQNLLGETRPVGRLRGQFFDHNGISVMCTYHPSYLLRTESAKKLVWEDMKLFMKQLGVDLS